MVVTASFSGEKTMRATTKSTCAVASMSREERLVIDALRIARSDTKAQQSPDVASLAKGVLTTRRLRAVWHLLTLLRDAFLRGARREKLKVVVRVLDAVIDSWYDAAGLARVSDLELHIAEEMAESAQDIAEIRFFARPSQATALQLVEAADAHIQATRLLMARAGQYIAPEHVS